jgi:hypothetical protein
MYHCSMDNVAHFAFRVDVVAFSVADLVKSAGALLFDRAVAGWDVTVGIRDGHDALALRILGLKAQPVECALESITSHPPPQLAVAADAWSCDAGVREAATWAMRSGNSALLLWGNANASELDRRLRVVHYQPSAAARAFKAHALAAAAVVDDPDRVESFRSNRRSVVTGLESTRNTPSTGKLTYDRTLAVAGQND